MRTYEDAIKQGAIQCDGIRTSRQFPAKQVPLMQACVMGGISIAYELEGTNKVGDDIRKIIAEKYKVRAAK